VTSRRSLVYSTSQFAETKLVRAELQRVPTSQVHAKEMGTTLTVCGEYTTSWFKFWDLPFANILEDRCPKCVAALETRARLKKEL
jgi:hypothetical protein